MDVSLAIADPNMAEFFTVLRSVGQFVAGGWSDAKTEIKTYGNASPASVRDIHETPETDFVYGMFAFWTHMEIFVTHEGGQQQGTSDIIVWKNEQYRILSVAPYPQRGYWKSVGARMSGS